MSCALLAVARDEDRFIQEWIDYHLQLGFNHIYICDNNDIDKPLIINNSKVTILDYRGIDFSKNDYGYDNGIQKTIYNEVLSKIDTQYDYCGVCDIDEFFDFKGLNLQDFIQKYFVEDGYTCVEIPWLIYTDNGLIHSIDKPVQELYTEVCNKMPFKWRKNECSWGKSIFKLNKGITMYGPHWPNKDSMPIFKTKHFTRKEYCVKHYRTKCLEDYLNHKVKQQHFATAPDTKGGNIIKTYFKFNDVTFEKIMYMLIFCKENNYKITNIDREFILKQFDEIKPITVVIRTHNRLDDLNKCIQSLYTQTCVPNILILDDNSKDETFKYVSNLKNVSYFKVNKNLGPGGILKCGRYNIQTPYYIILDDDDTYKDDTFIEYMYNMFIDYPDYDMYSFDCYLHVFSVVRTQKLLDCPMLSAWGKDDWYFIWIKKNSNKCPKLIEKDFYNYNYEHKKGKCHLIDESYIAFVTHNFYYEKNYDEIIKYIDKMYHKCNEKDRKVFDEVKEYLNKK